MHHHRHQLVLSFIKLIFLLLLPPPPASSSRLRSRHRRRGQGQSSGDDPLSGDDAPLRPRPARACGEDRGRRRRRSRLWCPHLGHRRRLVQKRKARRMRRDGQGRRGSPPRLIFDYIISHSVASWARVVHFEGLFDFGGPLFEGGLQGGLTQHSDATSKNNIKNKKKQEQEQHTHTTEQRKDIPTRRVP